MSEQRDKDQREQREQREIDREWQLAEEYWWPWRAQVRKAREKAAANKVLPLPELKHE